jgi:hypothetical protein
MSMTPAPRSLSDEEQKLVQEFFNNGGTVTHKKYGARTEDIGYTGGFYQRRKKKADEGKEEE